jgi:diacylglycerol kinase
MIIDLSTNHDIPDSKDNTDADAFAVLSLLLIAYTFIVYVLNS